MKIVAIILLGLFITSCGYTKHELCNGKLTQVSESDIEVKCSDGRVLVIHAAKRYLEVSVK